MVLDTQLNSPDYTANTTFSSEKSAYPVSNVYDLDRRRKVWRTNGYWNIESGKNTIVFQESIGVDITATIAVDEYTSTSSLLTAIKNAMDAAGAATYTVVQDATTGRIKLTSDLSGGATVFRLQWLTEPDLGEMLGFDVSANDTGAATYTADLLRIHTSEWIKWDLGSPINPSAFICVDDRNSGLKISENAILKIQGNHTDDWSAPAVNLTLNYVENVLAYADPDGLAGAGSSGYRYWRFYIEDKSNPNLYVQLGVAFLGKHVATTRGCPEFPLEISAIDNSFIEYSESGAALSGRRPDTESFALNWAALDTETCEALHNVWKFYGIHSSFFVAMDSEEAFSTDSETMIRLVKFQEEPTRRLVSPGNWSYTWQVREQL